MQKNEHATPPASDADALPQRLNELNLNNDGDVLYSLVAEKLHQASFVLIGAGAGFSADSGLAVYKDIANVRAYREENLSYHDLCSPTWLPDSPDVFFGFHGSCFNSYRDVTPHSGYNILLRWQKHCFSNAEPLKDALANAPMFVLTSNVDMHFEKAGFATNHVHPIHGEYEFWQCMDGECPSPIVRPPPDFRFKVVAETMKAAEETIKTSSAATAVEEGCAGNPRGLRFDSNHPRCGTCNKYLRPNVLMFSDMDYRRRKDRSSSTYYEWVHEVEKKCKNDKHLRVVILELGCGMNVPSIRSMCSSFANSLPSEQVTFVRINPGDRDGYNVNNMIYVPKKGREALTAIDSILSELKKKDSQQKSVRVQKTPTSIAEENHQNALP